LAGLLAGLLAVVGFVLMPVSPAFACGCNASHAVWWQEQHHSGGVIAALARGMTGDAAGLLWLTAVAAASVVVWAVRRRRQAGSANGARGPQTRGAVAPARKPDRSPGARPADTGVL
jgi:hypothetical protein